MSFNENGVRKLDFVITKSATKQLRKDWKDYSKGIPTYPETFKGKGIVICGGGITYYTCAWIAIKMLRKKKCTLPIELWYIGKELNIELIAELKKLNVRCVNSLDFDNNNFNGYALKPFSIIYSSFEEVIFLDADNICLKNIENLFEMNEYKETGAIFWPDYWKTAPDNPMWEIMGVNYTDMPEQESGQMVINKKTCWKPLNLCLYLNQRKNIYYKFIHGDKDTFRFSWLALNKKFFMVKSKPDTCGFIDDEENFIGFTMLQYSLTNEPLFLHRNLIKWDVTQNNEILWQKIKRFGNDSQNKIYKIRFSYKNNYYYMDFQGDYEELDFQDTIGDIEVQCLTILRKLRKKKIYIDYFINEYIRNKRNL